MAIRTDMATNKVRRTSTKGFAMASMALTGASAGIYWRMRSISPYRPTLEQITLTLPSGYSGLSGLRIGFLSDIHAGPFVSAEHVAQAAGLLAAESPDLILLGGDFVSESPRHLRHSMPVLGELCRSAPFGGFAVLGNHDIFVSSAKVTDALESEGISLLRNASAKLTWNGADFWIVGIDDSLHGRPDIDIAFKDVPDGQPSLTLWHEPQFADQIAKRGSIAQFSGHSHGGQIRVPGIRPVWLPRHGRKHIMGLNIVEGMPVYTSRGVGVYRPPLRLNCPPEVTLVTLR